MKVKQQTNQLLILSNTSDWPFLQLIFIVLVPMFTIGLSGLLIWAFISLSGFVDYVSFKCHRINFKEGHCRFLRISPIRPYYYRFPVNELTGVKLQKPKHSAQRQGNARFSRASRAMLKTSAKTIPFTYYYTNNSRKSKDVQSKIQSFIKNSQINSVIVRIRPNIVTLILAAISLPSLILALIVSVLCALVASSVNLRIDRTLRQVTFEEKFILPIGVILLGNKFQQCSFQNIKQIDVERVERTSTQKAKTLVDYVLSIRLHSDDIFFTHYYFERQQADEIAQLIRSFLE